LRRGFSSIDNGGNSAADYGSLRENAVTSHSTRPARGPLKPA
jgi:hypothetical protein